MDQAVVAPADARRRTSIIVTSAIVIALVAVSILFAANTQWYFVFKMLHVGAAVVWVGGGLFLAICAVIAELASNDDQLLQVGYWAETVAGRLFPLMSFVVLGFGIAMTANGDIAYNQFWIVFGLIAWALSAATGILFLGPEAKRLNKAAAAHGPKSPEVQGRLQRILLVVRVDVALMFLIVFDMVAKPFS
ncbi:MAG: hypothetical protein QOG06_167 [Gaiellaceae bacterium]|jgi:uncharacterized membrane protein|nr:hypothetical protein [Gaiellaceae bacterium]